MTLTTRLPLVRRSRRPRRLGRVVACDACGIVAAIAPDDAPTLAAAA